MTHHDKIALVALRSCPDATNRSVDQQCQRYGSATAAADALVPQSLRQRSGDKMRRLQDDGVRLLARDEPDYPAALAQIPDAPLLLFVRGTLTPLDEPSVAIVGSRRASLEGRRIARALAEALGASAITVVSGLARGIDGAAHEGALAASGRTLAVLGSGIDVVYPPEHSALSRRISEHGALISELGPGAPPLPQHFPMRNRIIAGMASAVVVVEAAERSGSLITAHLATDLGRAVLAVPGSPLAEGHRGTNKLIREGAALLQSIEDLIEELPEAARLRFAQRAANPDPEVSDEERRVLALLDDREPRALDHLAAAAGLPPPRVLAVLAALELHARAAKLPGSRWLRLPDTARLVTPAPIGHETVLSSEMPFPPGAH